MARTWGEEHSSCCSELDVEELDGDVERVEEFDCCPNDSTHNCSATGCCDTSKNVVCGDAGGNECCAKAEYCGAGVCCDPAKNKTLSKDGSVCCDVSAACGDDCCANGNACCKDSTHAAKPNDQCAKEVTDTCCSDGSSCALLETCCYSAVADATTCCAFQHTCNSDGTCSAPKPPGPPPPGPGPAPGPSPGPPTNCHALEMKWCGSVQSDKMACLQCFGKHGQDMMKNGCSIGDERDFCHL